ncbi:MAG: c-type cytochrome [Deltaproteobacteria bacterium]|nr:c-type cytochrome [Deltaproteobacteria bacterium]
MLTRLKLGITFSLFLVGRLTSMPFNQDMVYLQPKTGEVMYDEPVESVPTDGSKREFPSVEEALAKSNPYEVTPRLLFKGKRLFLKNCSQCHGVYLDSYRPGAVQPFVYGLDLSTQDMKLKPDGHFYSAILYGFPQIGDTKIMYPYRVRFTDEEAWAIVSFIRHMQDRRLKGD